MTENTKSFLLIGGLIAAVFVFLAIVLSLTWSRDEDAKLVLRADGCAGLLASGVAVELLPGAVGICSVSGKYYRGARRSVLVIGGVEFEMSAIRFL